LDYLDVEFKWTEVEHADYYLIQLGIGSNFTGIYFDTIVSGTSVIVDELNSLLPLKWRVTPFNKTDFCDVEPSELIALELTDVSSTTEIDLDSKVRLIPNVLAEENTIAIESGNLRFKDFEIYSHTGVKIQSGVLTDQEIKLSLDLYAGMYFVVLNNDSQKVTLKFLQQ